MQFEPGDYFDRYRLVRIIGTGGFGVVWLAEDPNSKMRPHVALKLAHDECLDPDAAIREAEIWMKIEPHPNIMPLIDVRVFDERLFLVTEYAPDGTLADWLSRHPRAASSYQEETDLLIGILSGLEHLHSRSVPVIHRDLKPRNVLMQERRPRLTDFGLARISRTLNRTLVGGTPSYMAPETFDGSFSVQSDIWAAGVILYELITGTRPFLQRDLDELKRSIRSEALPPLPADVPSQMRAVVYQALEKHPGDRFESAGSMKEALALARNSQSAYHPLSELKRKSPFIEAVSISKSESMAAVVEPTPILTTPLPEIEVAPKAAPPPVVPPVTIPTPQPTSPPAPPPIAVLSPQPAPAPAAPPILVPTPQPFISRATMYWRNLLFPAHDKSRHFLVFLIIILFAGALAGTTKKRVVNTWTAFARSVFHLTPRWLPGARDPKHPHIYASSTRGKWELDTGYTWIDERNRLVTWTPGVIDPAHPHVLTGSTEGRWEPEAGYIWLDEAAKSVKWVPGTKDSMHPHVIAAATEGAWEPEAGYAWSSTSQSDRSVKWSPGKENAAHPHVVAADTEGTWKPQAGYAWINPAASDFQVKWSPGALDPAHPHIYASTTEGKWKPQAGYLWLSSADSELRVKWTPGALDPAHPHVIASTTEGSWKPAAGYIWVSPGASNLRTVWSSGREDPANPHVISAATEGYWKPEAGYVWLNPSNAANDKRVKRE